ncbi:hypothetical protein ABI59_14510 [Acidobacteria bacterium Mor1]|nr:hypothetical protein ABI59_14510 [Acidobacteria bacterium Mor1]
MYCANRACPDVVRSGLPGEYRAGTTDCPKCGEGLTEQKPDWATDGAGSAGEAEFTGFVRLGRIHNTGLIPMVKSLLDAQGIRHHIANERTHDLVGYPRLSGVSSDALIGIPEVLVEPERLEEARELLSQIEEFGVHEESEEA